MLLEAKGNEVLLFDARDRAGGRLHTSPSGFEEGAEWVDEDHERMRGLMRQLGVAEVPAPEGDYLLQFEGERCREGSLWAEAAEDLRAFETAAGMSPSGDTIAELISRTCGSKKGRWLASASIRTDEGDEPERLGLSQWLAFRELYSMRQGMEASAYRIEGGGKKFVQRLLSMIDARPRFSARLLGVTENRVVRLDFDGFSAEVDAAVLALPAPCLSELFIDPPLRNHEEHRNLGFAPAVKARLQFASAFWKTEGWHGYLKTDGLLQQTWPDREDAHALVAYIVGDAARALSQVLDPGETLAREGLLGHKPTYIEVKDWTVDPFARGAFSLAKPGSDPVRIRQRDARKIQVAGEFCATWMGFMEGALESAETAVSALS
jgi:monoamine oxidase